LVEAIKESKGGKVVGNFSKDVFPGTFMDAWRSVIKKAEFEMVIELLG
jgi:nucleosome binding factor SPN SPT16 subunit